MRLPNAERAQVDPRKLTEYLLSLSHPRGRGKALFFQSFGFDLADPGAVERALLRHSRENEIVRESTSLHGVKYEIEGPMPSPDGRSPVIVSVWMVDRGSDSPRFVTAKPGTRRSP